MKLTKYVLCLCDKFQFSLSLLFLCILILKIKFENILAEVNDFGNFQLRTIVLMIVPRVTLSFHFLLNNLVATVPFPHCDISSLDDVFRDLSLAERLIVSILVQEDGTPSSCWMFAEPQYHLLVNSSDVTDLITVLCQNGWVYDNTTYKFTLASEVNFTAFHLLKIKLIQIIRFILYLSICCLFFFSGIWFVIREE